MHIYNVNEINYICKYFVSHISKNANFERFVIDLNEQKSWVDVWLEALKAGRPIEYVAGEAAFMNLELIVGEGVLIPRPETEELCALMQKDLKFMQHLQVLDIGCGSGCISVFLKKSNPNWVVHALDISDKAREFTLKNTKKYNLQIEFHLLDFLKHSKHIKQEFDVLVSNPPYISRTEKATIAQQVLDHEPHIALFPESDDDLIFYKTILEFSKSNLKRNGFIFFELNASNANRVCILFQATGIFDVVLLHDISGKPRFIKAQKIMG